MNEYELQGSKILIVDDNPTNLEILSHYLSRSGYRVFVKKNGKQHLSL